ncbi:MAG: lysophospholipid acyltransferase family protein [Silvanigrellaceae bacterium]
MLFSIVAIFRMCGIVTLALLLNLFLIFLPGSKLARIHLTSSFFKLILSLCGVHVDCKIPPALLHEAGRKVIVANHISYLDILIVSSLRPCIFLAKKEVGGWPLFGWVARVLGCIFVHRESLMGRACALRNCLKASHESDIALFPEGTTTAARYPDLKVWAKGHAWLAQRAGADAILCLGLVYENQQERAWIDDDALLPHLFATLRRPKTKVIVTGAWVPVEQSIQPARLAHTTHFQLCTAVANECS